MADHISPDPNLGSYGIERDDDTPGRTIPEKITPGQRYAVKGVYGLWTVCEWDGGQCDCVNESGTAESSCAYCRGTGQVSPYPIHEVADLAEAEARLLVYGAEMVAVLEEVVRIIGIPSSVAQVDALERAEPQIRDVLAKARGTT